ncbi:MAG: TonB-dependent receptor [Bryobacterales bacterium]|nr:TonB-dependent receptor [Bryobacterales bacterium]
MQRLRLGVLALAWIGFASTAYPQAFSSLSGIVTDSSGAAIPGAQVSASNLETGAERTVETNEQGLYTIPLLPPGMYQVAVTKEGFRSAIRDGLRLEVNQAAQLEIQLELGAVTETVEVTESVPLLESQSSSLGQVIETKAIVDLPLNGRNFVQLATLGPGVTGVGFGASGTIMSGSRPDDLRPGSELFSNGNREGSNNFLMDGVDNNERLTLAITLRPSVEAVREFKIQTNMFAAEQGRNAGATVNVITKSGSNQWHGAAYEFLRNNALDARQYFASGSAPKPPYRQNQFGAAFGGRIIRNKLFFFTNYEGFQKRQANARVNTVPTVAMRSGDFSGVRDIFDPATTVADPATASKYRNDPFPNRQIPLTRFDSVTSRLIQAYPLPDSAGLVNNQLTTPKDKQQWNQGDVRIDHNLNEKNAIFGRFSQQNTTTTRPATFLPTTVPGMMTPVALGNEDTFAGDSALKAYNVVGNWVHTFSPEWVLEARMGFNRFDLDFRQEGAIEGAKLGEELGVINSNQGPQADGIPIFSPSGYTGIGQTRSLPILRQENTYNPNFTLTNIRGSHTLKYGFQTALRNVRQFQTNRGNGRFNFGREFSRDHNNAGATGDAMAGFLLGAASTIEQDFTLVYPNILVDEYSYFVQDDWRVNDRLTLNLGLRYEYDTRARERDDQWTNFDVVTGKLLIAGYNSDSYTGVKPDRNNFAPRFGFAYRLRKGTILRGGYGIFYNKSGSEGVVMRRHRQLPFGPINSVNINAFSSTPRMVQDGFDPIPNLDFGVVADNPVGAMLAVASDFRTGYAQQFNMQLQQELPYELVFKVGYVGNVNSRLDTTWDFNQPLPGPGGPAARRPLYSIAPNVVGVTYNTTDANSNYNALQTTLERRFSENLGFLAAYTWSHSIDTTANAFGGAANGPFPQDVRNRAADRGTSGFDIRHRFTYSTNYTVPIGKGQAIDFNNKVLNNVIGGWKTNGIVTLQSGLPFTPTLNSSVSNAGGSRPDLLHDATLDNPDRARWFDTSFKTSGAAWGEPAQFTFGNAGRNILRGPGRVNVDFSLFKDIAISERFNLQYRAEMFNIFNTPQFGLPNSSIGNPNAGIITSMAGNPRQIQMGLRLSF